MNIRPELLPGLPLSFRKFGEGDGVADSGNGRIGPPVF